MYTRAQFLFTWAFITFWVFTYIFRNFRFEKKKRKRLLISNFYFHLSLSTSRKNRLLPCVSLYSSNTFDSRCVGSPHVQQFSVMSAGCHIIPFSSTTIWRQRQMPQVVKGSVPQDCPHSRGSSPAPGHHLDF